MRDRFVKIMLLYALQAQLISHVVCLVVVFFSPQHFALLLTLSDLTTKHIRIRIQTHQYEQRHHLGAFNGAEHQ